MTAGFIYEKWLAVVTERDDAGKRHFWNQVVDARDAGDAVDAVLAGYDLDRVEGVEVERASEP